MKNLLSFLGSALLCAAIFSSCTMEKRVHRTGYYVQWHKVVHKPKADHQTDVPVMINVSSRIGEIDLSLPVDKQPMIVNGLFSGEVRGEKEVDTVRKIKHTNQGDKHYSDLLLKPTQALKSRFFSIFSSNETPSHRSISESVKVDSTSSWEISLLDILFLALGILLAILLALVLVIILLALL